MTTTNQNTNSIYSVHWYPNEFPKQHDLVIVKLTKVDEMGIWVELLEYASKEGMIPIGQYTTRKMRRVPKSVKVGKIDTALVSRVDVEKENMDLTRQSLKEEDIKMAQKRFADYKSLMSLILYVSEHVKGQTFKELVEKIAYPLHETFGNAYIGLQKSYNDPQIINQLSLPDEVKDTLREEVNKMFKPTEVRIHGLFEAEVTKPQGVDALRDALVSGYSVLYDTGNEEIQQKLQLTVIAPPIYSISIEVYDADKGKTYLDNVLKTIGDAIKAVDGRFLIKEEPKVINKTDLDKFKAKLEELAKTTGEEVDDNDEMEPDEED